MVQKRPSAPTATRALHQNKHKITAIAKTSIPPKRQPRTSTPPHVALKGPKNAGLWRVAVEWNPLKEPPPAARCHLPRSYRAGRPDRPPAARQPPALEVAPPRTIKASEAAAALRERKGEKKTKERGRGECPADAAILAIAILAGAPHQIWNLSSGPVA